MKDPAYHRGEVVQHGERGTMVICRGAPSESPLLVMVLDSGITNNGTYPSLFVDNVTGWLDMNESEYLNMIMGPKYLPLKLVLPVTFAYVVIFVTGIFGNVVTCIVIWRNPTMQTATNYYLFNLAISDLSLLCLGLPNELSVFWQQYPWKLGLGMCKIRAYVSEVSSYVSVLTIVAFSLERYLAICHPLYLYVMSGLKRPIWFIIFAWLVAFLCAAPFAVYTTVNYVEYPPKSGKNSEDSAFCAMLRGNMPDFPLYEMSCLIFFLVPMLLIAVLYVRMGLKIQSRTLGRTIDGCVHGETKQAQSRKAIIRMLSAVVIMFFICWAPFHAQRLLYVYEVSSFAVINDWLYPIGGCLYYFSTTVNPILYNMMSAKYRGAFKKTLCCSPSSPSIIRDDLSSLRDTTDYVSRRWSQKQIRRSVHYQPSMKRGSTNCSNDLLKSSRWPRPESDGEENHCGSVERSEMSPMRKATSTMTIVEPLLREKKISLVVQSSNGRAKCRTTGRTNGSAATETRI